MHFIQRIHNALGMSMVFVVGCIFSTASLAQDDDPKHCIEFFGGRDVKGGAIFSIRNNCGVCLQVSPRVRMSNGNILPVGADATLGHPIWSVNLKPGSQQALGYSTAGLQGQFVPFIETAKPC